MSTIKTSDLTGAALDWAVAKACGLIDAEVLIRRAKSKAVVIDVESKTLFDMRFGRDWRPSHAGEQGGPIIEREGIATRKHGSGIWYAMAQADVGDGQRSDWHEFTWRNPHHYPDYPHEAYKRRQRFSGPTALIAAMRCYVASKLGPEVEVPQELLA